MIGGGARPLRGRSVLVENVNESLDKRTGLSALAGFCVAVVAKDSPSRLLFPNRKSKRWKWMHCETHRSQSVCEEWQHFSGDLGAVTKLPCERHLRYHGAQEALLLFVVTLFYLALRNVLSWRQASFLRWSVWWFSGSETWFQAGIRPFEWKHFRWAMPMFISQNIGLSTGMRNIKVPEEKLCIGMSLRPQSETVAKSLWFGISSCMLCHSEIRDSHVTCCDLGFSPKTVTCKYLGIVLSMGRISPLLWCIKIQLMFTVLVSCTVFARVQDVNEIM